MGAPSLVDHALALFFAVVLPVWGWATFPKVKRKLAEDRPGVRIRLYRRTMLWQWAAAAIVVGTWIAQGRTAAGLGFQWPGTIGTWITVAVVLALIAFMSYQAWTLVRHPEVHPPVLEQLETAAPFLPRNRKESSWFLGTAITAGICEEIMFRGFLIAYGSVWFGAWGAVVATSLAFGLGHAYQGKTGAIKTTIAGLVGGALYLIGGTLFLPVLLHAFVDVHGGVVYRIVRR